MRITQLTWTKIFVPFKEAHLWGGGRRPGPTRLIVRIDTDAGVTGVGETICLLPFVEPVVAAIADLVTGMDPRDFELMHRKVLGAGFYHHKRAMVAAWCGVEMACWDLLGKSAGLPIYRFLGGAYRREIPLIAYLFIRKPEEVAREAAEFVARGYRTIKLKIGLDPEQDIEIVRRVREAVGPTVRVRADVNGAWTPGTARRQLHRLAPYDLEYVEQPLMYDDLPGHAELRRWSPVPIGLDESAYTNVDVLNIIRLNAADVILLDPHESAGIWECRKGAAIAEAAGIAVTLHSGAELGLSTAAYLHLAASTPNLMLAIDNQYENLSDDVVTVRHAIRDGSMRVPEGPGLGVEVDWAKVERYRTDEIKDAYLDTTRPDWFTVKPAY
jgi:L-rhamnonate dehydratase